MSSEQYWMVLGNGMPRYRHPTELSARTEAYRLASLNPDCTFTVLQAVASVRVPRNPLPCWLSYDQPHKTIAKVELPAAEHPNEFQATGQVIVGLNSASVMTTTEEPPF